MRRCSFTLWRFKTWHTSLSLSLFLFLFEMRCCSVTQASLFNSWLQVMLPPQCSKQGTTRPGITPHPICKLSHSGLAYVTCSVSGDSYFLKMYLHRHFTRSFGRCDGQSWWSNCLVWATLGSLVEHTSGCKAFPEKSKTWGLRHDQPFGPPMESIVNGHRVVWGVELLKWGLVRGGKALGTCLQGPHLAPAPVCSTLLPAGHRVSSFVPSPTRPD